MAPSVSIITVHYNTPDDLRNLSRSLQQHVPSTLYEFIVVDNNSTTDLAREITNARYLRLSQNDGFGAGSNRGAEAATAPALFFVNPDCEFVEDCVTPLLNALQKAAVCGPRVVYPDGTLQLSFGPYLSIGNEATQRKRMRNEKTESMQHWITEKGEFSPDYVSGCSLMMRADIFHAIGGFDEKFFLYHEDVDLCKRVTSRGEQVLYVPSTRIVHRKNTSTSREPARVSKEYRRSQIHYYRKHHGPLQNALLQLYLAVAGKST